MIEDIESLKSLVEKQRKDLIRLEERNMELAKALTNVMKDVIMYQAYVNAEIYRTDYKTVGQMRQDLYYWKEKAEGVTNGK